MFGRIEPLPPVRFAPRLRFAAALALVAGASADVAGAQPGPGVRFAVPPPGTLSAPPNVVYGIEQDALGYLWVASEQGLHRYDGVEFEAFRADPSDPGAMPGNRVTAVSVAPDGDVWAGVDRFGLVRYDAERRRFDRFQLSDSLARDPHIAVDAEGAVWVTNGGWDDAADDGASVYRLDPARRTLHRVVGVRSRGWGLHLDGDRQLWVLEADGMVERLDGGWRRHRIGSVIPVLGASMRAIRDGTLLELGASGRFQPRRTAPDVASRLGEALRRVRTASSTTPIVDSGGRLWAGRADGGLLAVDLATGQSVGYANDPTRAESIPEGIISEVYEDRDGVVWIGGSQGLRTVAPGWDVYQTTPLGRLQFASVLARGSSGRLWGGAACQAPSQIMPDGRAVPMAEVEPAVARAVDQASFCVSNVLEARDGTFWFSGWPFLGSSRTAGVLRVEPDGAARQYRGAEGAAPGPFELPLAASRMAHEDAAGRIWAATEGGLVRIEPDSLVVYTAGPGGLDADVIWSLADAPDGRLWVGTYGGGLSLFDPDAGAVQTWRHDPADAGTLPSDAITAVLPSRHEPGVVWVGTYDGGLVRFEPATGRMRRIERADGLPSLTVKGLAEDAAGALWIGTDAGLVRRDAAGALRVYTEADGLPDSNVGLYDLAALPDGRVAVAVGSNLVTFDPAATDPRRVDANVVLRALRIEGTRRALPDRGAPIRLAPGERAVGVELAALSFRAPQRLRYSVRLDGVDDRWLPLGADRSAAWAGLAPGTYRLRARAGVLSGTWSRRELSVPVVVEPAWWERRAVRGLAALAALALFGLAVRDLSQRRLRRRVQALELARRLQRERERISRDLHDHVGAQLSSLLAGVELARLARERGAPPGLGDPLDAVEDDARTTMRQLRETIWALHGEAVTLPDFCERVRADLAARCPPGLGTAVTCDGPPDAELTPTQALNLYRVVQEAVTNALKYAGAERLAVRLSLRDGEIAVEVSDDGAFRAGTSGGDGAAPGGFGMRSMAARAEALGGTFELDTDRGTTVRVCVPAEAADLPASGEAPRAPRSDV